MFKFGISLGSSFSLSYLRQKEEEEEEEEEERKKGKKKLMVVVLLLVMTSCVHMQGCSCQGLCKT